MNQAVDISMRANENIISDNKYLDQISQLRKKSSTDKIIAPVILADQRHVERDTLYSIGSSLAQITEVTR